MSELEVGLVVKVNEIVEFEFEAPYVNPTGQEGVIIGYDISHPDFPWVVEFFEAPTTPTYLYPELFADDELEAME